MPKTSTSESGASNVNSSTDGTAFRSTQRPPLSCTECTRRKSRCNREVPCLQCLKRGRGDLCERETVLVKGRIRSGNDDAQVPLSRDELMLDNALLRQRIEDLEHLVEQQQQRAAGGGSSTSSLSNKTSSPFKAPSRSPPFNSSQSPESTSNHTNANSPATAIATATGGSDLEQLVNGIDLLAMGLKADEVADDDDIWVGGGESFNASAIPSSSFIPSFPFSPRTVPPTADGTSSSVPSFTSLHQLIPPLQRCNFLIEQSFQTCWIHCAIHAPTFRKQHNTYWALRSALSENQVGYGWLALYFSMLCASMTYFPESCLAFGFSAEELEELPRLWLNASLDALSKANFMASHQLATIQTVCVLTLVLNNWGQSSLHAALMATVLRIAQTLNIHRLGEEPYCEPHRQPGSKCQAHGIEANHVVASPGLIRREVARRVWFSLIINEWLSIQSREPNAVISRASFTSVPMNIDDEDLVGAEIIYVKPPHEPTLTSNHLSMGRLAFILKDYYSQSETDRHSTLMEYEKSLDTFFDPVPFFDPKKTVAPDLLARLPYIGWARRLWALSLNNKRILANRAMFAKSFGVEGKVFERSRTVCVEAARDILTEMKKEAPPYYDRNWAIALHTLGATVILAINLLHSPSNLPEFEREARRNEVKELLNAFPKNGMNYAYGKRGLTLVQALLAEESRFRQFHSTLRNQPEVVPLDLQQQQQQRHSAVQVKKEFVYPVQIPPTSSASVPIPPRPTSRSYASSSSIPISGIPSSYSTSSSLSSSHTSSALRPSLQSPGVGSKRNQSFDLSFAFPPAAPLDDNPILSPTVIAGQNFLNQYQRAIVGNDSSSNNNPYTTLNAPLSLGGTNGNLNQYGTFPITTSTSSLLHQQLQQQQQQQQQQATPQQLPTQPAIEVPATSFNLADFDMQAPTQAGVDEFDNFMMNSIESTSLGGNNDVFWGFGGGYSGSNGQL